MTLDAPGLSELVAPAPVLEEVVAEYAAIEAAFDGAGSTEARRRAVLEWDALLRRIDTWEALTLVRFHQDTRDAAYKEAYDHLHALRPKLTALAARLQRKLLGSPHRPPLEAELGRHAFAVWQAEADAFDPAIEEAMVEEARLVARYTELLASAELPFRGEVYNLSTIGRLLTDPDRETRHAAQRVRWGFFEAHAAELDGIFGELVALRDGMGRALGLDGYTDLGYRRMSRIDYGREDVERFRREVREQVVPLAQELRERQARRLGVEKLKLWDEGVHDPAGNPKPRGDAAELVERAERMFDRMHPELGGFFRLMQEKGVLDLLARDGKAGGGFCMSFPTIGLPFIFAHFNGTKDDVRVLTHELGHAFQFWRSRDKPLMAYQIPTMEACEIHSMALELLALPHMECFFEEDAERFRTLHITEGLLFLPYGVAVDHFQHEVYARPDASAADRHALWRELEATYLPWRDAGDLSFVAKGGQWQHQRHIFRSPFYYIDYALALTCAFQLWARAANDPKGALQAYLALCDRGGDAPFRTLASSAALKTPFDPGCLTEVTTHARQALALT